MNHLLSVLPWGDAGDLPLQFEDWLCSWTVWYGEEAFMKKLIFGCSVEQLKMAVCLVGTSGYGLVTEMGKRCVAVTWQQRSCIKLNRNKSRCYRYEEGTVYVVSQQQIDEETKEKIVFYCLNEG